MNCKCLEMKITKQQFQDLWKSTEKTYVCLLLEKPGQPLMDCHIRKSFCSSNKKTKNFFFKHKDVAAYFAPEGDDYSWQAFAYQLKKGNQKRIPAGEIKKLSDYATAAAKYRAERKKFGPFLSTKNEAYLYNFRKGLEENYPGYSSTPSFNPADVPNLIKNLNNAMVNQKLKTLKQLLR
jgi:hypothetical protein